MNTKLGIDELREAADRAEREAQQAMRERAAAVTRSQEALRAASKARQKYVRARRAHSRLFSMLSDLQAFTRRARHRHAFGHRPSASSRVVSICKGLHRRGSDVATDGGTRNGRHS
jgi:hypothetical protein